MARSSWDAALTFGGFPIHLKAYTLMESKGADSFKNLCPCHKQPVTMPKTCAVDGTQFEQAELSKGVEVARGDVRELTPEAVESITGTETTKELEILGLPLASSIPNIATAYYRLVPNDKVPGAAQPVGILWNGLLASERACITEVVMRSGSRRKLLAITADTHGLTGLALPYVTDLREPPEHKFEVNEQAAQMFEAFASQQGIAMDTFVHSDYQDEYKARRDEAIKAALAGKPLAIPAKAEKAPVADLMAAMAAALDTSKPPAKAKAPAKKKAAK